MRLRNSAGADVPLSRPRIVPIAGEPGAVAALTAGGTVVRFRGSDQVADDAGSPVGTVGRRGGRTLLTNAPTEPISRGPAALSTVGVGVLATIRPA